MTPDHNTATLKLVIGMVLIGTVGAAVVASRLDAITESLQLLRRLRG